MSNSWNGQERRGESKDHDTLIEVVQILKNHVSNFDNLSDNFKAHEQRDEHNFSALRKDNLNLQRGFWMAAGVLMALEALPIVLKLMHILNK